MQAQPSHADWLDSILEALPDPTLVLRPHGELFYANRAADHLTRPGDSQPQAANRLRIARFVADLVTQGRLSGAETLILTDPVQATDMPVGATAKSAIWTNGEPAVIVTLQRDLGAKTLLIANTSHELRTPLNAILGYTSLLLAGVNGEVSSRQRSSLERIDSNAQHLLALINDLLDLSMSDAGKMPVRLTRFDLAQLVRET